MKLTDVTTGRRARPQKVMIYGVEGIGKSTLASQFPNPIFLDVEDRTAHLDIHRLIPKNWNQMQAALQSLYDEDHGYQTVVVDTADWAEMLAAQDVCERFNKSGIGRFRNADLGMRNYARFRAVLMEAIMIERISSASFMSGSRRRLSVRPESMSSSIQ